VLGQMLFVNNAENADRETVVNNQKPKQESAERIHTNPWKVINISGNVLER
jgi:hypothetical protein